MKILFNNTLYNVSKHFSTILLSSFMLFLVLSIMSCEKEKIFPQGQKSDILNTARLDSSLFSFTESHYIDLVSSTKSSFQTATFDTTTRSIVFRNVDSVNYIVHDDYYLFTTEKGYYEYTDFRGLDEQAADNIDIQVYAFLSSHGVEDSSDLTPGILASVDSIRTGVSLMPAGPLRAFHRNQFDNPPLIGNVQFLILPGAYHKNISSYQTKSDLVFTWKDKFYSKILCRAKHLMVTYIIPGSIDGWSWRFSFTGYRWDNATASWRKTL